MKELAKSMKIRLQFEKNIPYISHLELMRAVQRMLKRTDLPLKYSQGFNPHVILSLANPIPVGVMGKSEFADFELTQDMEHNEILERIANASDKNIRPVEIFFNQEKSFQSARKAIYKIEIKTKDIEKTISFLDKKNINTIKKSKGREKIIDLKEYIFSYECTEKDDGIDVICTLACGNEKNLNPLLIKKAMENDGIGITSFLPTRYNILDDEDNDFISEQKGTCQS